MNVPLPTTEVETAANPEFSVIWLHGLGADGSDFLALIPELRLSGEHALRFVFPDAPSIPVTCNGGYVMPAWYDIIALDSDSRRVDAAGIERSRQAVGALIEREIERGIACERIFIAGFSQGGAIAYTSALAYPQRLAGVIALSTYIPLSADLAARLSAANRALPIFAAHGSDDDVVAPQLGAAARDWLRSMGYAPQWHEYAMAHGLCPDEARAIGAWLDEAMRRGAR